VPVNIETGELTAERHRIPTPQPSVPDANIIERQQLSVPTEISWHMVAWMAVSNCGHPLSTRNDGAGIPLPRVGTIKKSDFLKKSDF
jgi:hypothetical protein